METIAFFSITICFLCCLWMILEITRHTQDMKIMNVVWPITCLYAGPLAIWAYYHFGRKHKNHTRSLFWQSVLKGALHCGSGCTLGDLLASLVLLLFPVTFFGSTLAADWTIEYVAAFLLGIIFQYYAIKPMRQLSTTDAVYAALKADALSLTAWQIGMYGWMAVSIFFIFHRQLKSTEPVYWLMMQAGMLFGLITAFPVNWWLIKKGIKEAM